MGLSRRNVALAAAVLSPLICRTVSFAPSRGYGESSKRSNSQDLFRGRRSCNSEAGPHSSPKFSPSGQIQNLISRSDGAANRRARDLLSSPAPSNGSENGSDLEPRVYGQRWVQLAYLSLLALLSDWICFSVAASPSTFEEAFPGHSAAGLIDMFLFTNVASCFLVTDTVNRFGLERAIKGAAALMTVGCVLRSGLMFLAPAASALGMNDAAAAVLDAPLLAAGPDGLASYTSVVAGTILVGAAQPFFQCTPPMLSATWFASDERATSTAVALNFNQIGIAVAFIVGGGMGTTVSGLSDYFNIISLVCLAVTVGTFLQFQNRPPSPPST